MLQNVRMVLKFDRKVWQEPLRSPPAFSSRSSVSSLSLWCCSGPFWFYFILFAQRLFSFRTCPCSPNYFYQFHLSLFPLWLTAGNPPLDHSSFSHPHSVTPPLLEVRAGITSRFLAIKKAISWKSNAWGQSGDCSFQKQSKQASVTLAGLSQGAHPWWCLYTERGGELNISVWCPCTVLWMFNICQKGLGTGWELGCFWPLSDPLVREQPPAPPWRWPPSKAKLFPSAASQHCSCRKLLSLSC